MFSLATVAAPTAAAQAPAPGNGTAIFTSYHADANGTYVDANGNPLPLDANGHPIDPATGRPIDPATGQLIPADPPPPPAPAPAPTEAAAGGAAPADDSDAKSDEQLGAVEPVDPKKKPHRSTPSNHGDRRKRHRHRHRQDRPHAAPPTPDTNQPAAPPAGPQPDIASAPPKQHVPDLVLERFDIPPFLLPVYQAAAVSYNVPWTVLAAINSVETDYGRNTNVSSAGALGWMQFMPATWRMYGVDANLDGKRDPYNPADAIFAAARYLDAAGADKDIRRAVYAYNHADWYVDMVMERAKALSKIPADVVDSLTGLAQARMPIPGKLKVEHKLGARKWTKLQATTGRRVVAAADGRIVSMGTDDKLGRFVVLEDAYGNRFTYAHLGNLAVRYAVPKKRTVTKAQVARELHLPHHDPHPSRPATLETAQQHHTRVHDPEHRVSATAKPKAKQTVAPEPTLANDMLVLRRARMAGAVTASERAIAAHAIGLKPNEVTLRTLHTGSRVVAGTILGHVAYGSRGKAAPVRFAVRPAGGDTPRVDARPLLKGWRLLQSTAVYGPAGTSTLNPTHGRVGLGQALLMGKEALGRRVLSDPRITFYDCGRQDIEAGQIDRRVLAVLEFLADSGFHPTVTALECGHSLMTASGNISEHSTGDAVDIAAINGIPIVGHQGPGSITDTVVRRLLELQGTMKPHQIITLMSYAGTDNTLALADHYDHIHVGFHPEAGPGSPSVTSALEPEQWSKFMSRLRTIDNPQVPTHVSRFAIPAKPLA